jgi:hypothetical protein
VPEQNKENDQQAQHPSEQQLLFGYLPHRLIGLMKTPRKVPGSQGRVCPSSFPLVQVGASAIVFPGP